ncbi:hypothetical protein CHUAL_011963 [Chamberlinius hualienensis]
MILCAIEKIKKRHGGNRSLKDETSHYAVGSQRVNCSRRYEKMRNGCLCGSKSMDLNRLLQRQLELNDVKNDFNQTKYSELLDESIMQHKSSKLKFKG